MNQTQELIDGAAAAEPQPDRHGRLRPVQAGPGSGLKLCRGDDKLDYRNAWDTGE